MGLLQFLPDLAGLVHRHEMKLAHQYPDTPCMPYICLHWGGLRGQLGGIYGSPMECLGYSTPPQIQRRTTDRFRRPHDWPLQPPCRNLSHWADRAEIGGFGGLEVSVNTKFLGTTENPQELELHG